MGCSFNQGGTPMDFVSASSTFSGDVVQLSWSLVVKIIPQSAVSGQQIWQVGGLSIVYNAASQQIVISYARSLVNETYTISSVVMSIGTTYSLVIRCQYDGAYTITASVDGSSKTVTQTASGSGTYTAATGTMYFGNNAAASADLIANTRNFAVYEGLLSDADAALFVSGYSPLQLVSATLRAFVANVNGTIHNVIPGSAAAMTVSGTTQVTSDSTLFDGPMTDTTSSFGYVTSGHVFSISVGSRYGPTVGYTNSTAGNVVCVSDESGTGRYAYQGTAANRPRFKIDADGDMRIGFCGNSGTNPASLSTNTSPGTVPNYGVTFGFVWSRSCADKLIDGFLDASIVHIPVGGGDNVAIGTDADGKMCVRVVVGGVTATVHTLSPAQFFPGVTTPMIFTISSEAGTSTRTFSLTTRNGTSSVTTASYTAGNGTISTIGPSTLSLTRGTYGIMKGADIWSRVLTSGEIQSQILAYERRFNIPRRSGVVVYNGSSTPEGDGTNRTTCANGLYQLGRILGVNGVGFGVFATTTAQYQLLSLSGSGTYTEGETVTQAGSGFSGIVAYQNGSTLYVRAGNVTPNAVNPMVGGSSGVSRTPGSVGASSGPTNHLWDGTGGRFDRMVAALNSFSGAKVLWFNGSSNTVELLWPVADIIEIDKRFFAAVKALVPGVKIVVATNIPRSGGHGSQQQSYNSSIRSVIGVWDVAPYDTMSPFDYLDSSGVNDNGVYDYSNAVYYQEDDGAADGIHANEASHKLIAMKAASSMTAFMPGSGGTRLLGSSSVRDFRRRSLVR